MFTQLAWLIAAQLKRKDAWSSQDAESISYVSHLPIWFITQNLYTRPCLSYNEQEKPKQPL